jgi:predicted nucleotidyltransferase
MSPELNNLSEGVLAEFCRRNRIRKLALFGSVLRGEERPDSDLDLLVEFEEGHEPGLLRLAGMERELSALLGRKVDLRTPQDLSRYFRDEVLASSEVQYAQG